MFLLDPLFSFNEDGRLSILIEHHLLDHHHLGNAFRRFHRLLELVVGLAQFVHEHLPKLLMSTVLTLFRVVGPVDDEGI